MKCFRLWMLGALVGALSTACGAVSSDKPEPKADDERPAGAVGALSIVDLDEAGGKLVLKFEYGGRAITYDLRLGPRMTMPITQEELAKDPELSTYETDARVLDANGQPFHLQMGGDSFIDGSWAIPPLGNFDVAGRLQDIQLMRTALPALRALVVPESLEQLRLSAIGIGRGVEATPEKPSLPTEPPEVRGNGEAPGSVRQELRDPLERGGSSVVKWDYRVRYAEIFGGAGNHSAVNLRGWSSSTNVVFNANSCNHGRCANELTTKCVMSGFLTDDGTHTRFFHSDRAGDTSYIDGGCTTHNDWDSTSVFGGAHNCNDDSELQINAIHSDQRQCTDCGSCNSLGLHNFAPGCR